MKEANIPGLKGVFFDLDGTLVDSREDLARALNTVLRSYGIPPLDVTTVTDLVGEGALRLVEKALPANMQRKVDEVLERFLQEYGEHLAVNTEPYPGIPELLERLSEDLPLAVVTNKRQAFSWEVLEKLGLARHVSVVVGPDTVGVGKPSPVPVTHALRELRIEDAGRAAMVGDSSFDIIAGKAAGTRTVGVTWGFRPRGELQGADFIIDRPEELLAICGVDV